MINPEAKASEEELNYPTKLNSKFGSLNQAVDSADARRRKGRSAFSPNLEKQLDVQLARWREVAGSDVPAFNAALRNANIPAITLK